MPTEIIYEKPIRFPTYQPVNYPYFPYNLQDVDVVDIESSEILGKFHEKTSELDVLSDREFLAFLSSLHK